MARSYTRSSSPLPWWMTGNNENRDGTFAMGSLDYDSSRAECCFRPTSQVTNLTKPRFPC